MDSGLTAGRRHRRRLLEITFVVGSFVAAGLVAAGVVAGADQPSIASDRSDYAPGNTVVLTGAGWVADEAVHVVVVDDASDAWSHEADVVAAADGTVSETFELPELAGTFAVTATAPSGSASAGFTVTAPTPPPPAPTGTPTLDSDEETYAPGDTVTLTGSDWQAGDTVHVAVNDDGSDAWDHSADVTVAADGTLTDTFDLPDGLAAEFTVTATDPTDRSATATFTTVSAPTGTPSLDSDEETYAPGDTVTLTGSDWQAGDTVHVAVNDDGSDAWDHSADVTVAADGTLTDTFDLPDGLAAEFTATATDPTNRSATATFAAGFGSATEPYLVRFAAGTSTDAQAQILAAAGAVSTNYIAPLRIHGVLLPGGAGLQTSLDKLRSYASVTRVEPDRTREAGGTPNDSNYGDQWSLTKIGWENVYGEVSISGTARVAILDTGIDGSHPDLDGNVVSGTSILDGSNGLSDPNGHGTAMAGIVAAETNNGAGVAGVGYAGVQVMPVTVLGADGTGQDSEIIEGVVYAAEHDADVILMAFSNPGYSEMLQAAIDYAWDEGAVLVAAAGNDGSSSPQFPAGDRDVIGVSNTDQNDALAGSSNSGQAIFLGAPGTSIVTTDNGGGTTTISGTSAAAAHVAGAAALVKAASGAANGVIVSRLARNAEAAGTRDQTGNGRLNLDRAMSDTSTASVQPAGAAPGAGGGPYVGPYVAASNNFTVAPATQSVAGGSTNTFVWTFTSNNAGNEQTTTFTIPTGWTAPQSANNLLPGFVSAAGSGANPCNVSLQSVVGMVVTIRQSPPAPTTGTCANNRTFTFTYADATAPTPASPPQTYTFTNQHGNSPTVTVTAPVARATLTTVTCTPNPIVLNQGTSCDAQVDDDASGPKSPPAGTVTFARSGAGAGTFSSATCTLTPLDADSSHCTTSVTYTPSSGTTAVHIITGTYGETPPHTGSSDGFDVTVNNRSTSTAVSCSPGTVVLNQATTCDAQVDDTAGGTQSNPSGTVTFSATPASSGTFSSTTCTLTPVAADPNSSHCTASVTYTPTSNPGTHTVNASYGGASPHAGSTDPDGFVLEVTKRDTLATVTCVPGTVAINESSSCDAKVDDVDAGTKSNPSGTVTFTRSGPGGGTFTGTCALTPIAADPDSSHCTSPVSYEPTSGAGTHVITGTYGGSALHEGDDDDFDLTVTKRDTLATVTCVPGTVAINESSSCDAKVDDVDAGTKSNPSGTVTFTRSGPGGGTFTGTCALTPIAADPDSSHCTSPVSYEPTSGAGTHVITGTYGGSALHEGDDDDFDLTVTKRDTLATVTCVPGTVAINESSSCDAKVDDVDAGTKSNPSGTVTFTRSGPGGGTFTGTCALTPIAADPDSSHCTSPVSYEPTSGAGTHVITGTYGGSALHEGDDDDFDLTVTKRDTLATVTCVPGTVAINESSSCDAKVDDVDAGTKSNPSGTVTFTRSGPGGGTFTGTCALTPIAADPDSSHCTSPVSYEPTSGAGTHVITGTYGGSALHEGDDDDFDLTVTKRDTLATVTCVPGTVAINESSSCDAKVDDVDAGTKSNPSGTVTFTRSGPGGGTFTGTCALTPIAADPDSSHCTSPVSYEPTSGAGTHVITGTYGGSALHEGDDDDFDLTVTKRATVTEVTCTPGSVVVNQSTSCTARVDDTSPGTKSNPSGTVTLSRSGPAGSTGTFSSMTCTLEPVPSDPDSSRCISPVTYTPTSGAGTHTITGTYGGSSLHEGSSDGFGLSVALRATQTSVACGGPVQIGNAITCTAQVDDIEAPGTKSPPTGQINFTSDGSGSGTFGGNPCSLTPIDADSSSCSVTYSSSAVAVDEINAHYLGSSVHKPSDSTTGAMAVFYDPNAGFATGGGWIMSPSCAHASGLTGKANFGFVSKYKKGASVPEGQTEFQFHAGNLNFHSQAYEWLVVAGARAQYKGTGTVNGASGYSFMLTAVDGQISGGGGQDKFRIKIWNAGGMIYDNKCGADDGFTAAESQVINGGSIVIHSK